MVLSGFPVCVRRRKRVYIVGNKEVLSLYYGPFHSEKVDQRKCFLLRVLCANPKAASERQLWRLASPFTFGAHTQPVPEALPLYTLLSDSLQWQDASRSSLKSGKIKQNRPVDAGSVVFVV